MVKNENNLIGFDSTKKSEKHWSKIISNLIVCFKFEIDPWNYWNPINKIWFVGKNKLILIIVVWLMVFILSKLNFWKISF